MLKGLKHYSLSFNFLVRHQSNICLNEVNIQMLPEKIHNHVFPRKSKNIDPRIVELAKHHLRQHDIPIDNDKKKEDGQKNQDHVNKNIKPGIDIDQPRLLGKNIEDHFWNLGNQLQRPYLELIIDFVEHVSPFPINPGGNDNNNDEFETTRNENEMQQNLSITEKLKMKSEKGINVKWSLVPGWIRYNPDGTNPIPVPYPQENIHVLDVESSPNYNQIPLFAVAISSKYIYSWISPGLLSNDPNEMNYHHLIPMKNDDTPTLCIGHNVSFDRGAIASEYNIKKNKRRFLDTLSLHCAVGGLSSQQRVEWMSEKKTRQKLDQTREEKVAGIEDYVMNEDDIGNMGNDSNSYSLNLDGIMEQSGKGEDKDGDESPFSTWKKQSSMNNLVDAVWLHCKGYKLDKSNLQILLKGTLQDIRDNLPRLLNYCANDVGATLYLFQALWPKFQSKCPHPITLAAILEMGSCILTTNNQWQDYIEKCERMHNESIRESNEKLANLVRETIDKGLLNESFKNDPWLNKLDWTPIPSKYTKPRFKKNGEYAKGGEPRPIGDSFLFGKPMWYKKLHDKSTGNIELTPKNRIVPYLLQMSWNGFPVHYIEGHGWCFEISFPSITFKNDGNGNCGNHNNKNDKNQNHNHNENDKNPPSSIPSFNESAIIFDPNLPDNPNGTKNSYIKIPHQEREGANVGSLLTKNHVKFVERGVLRTKSNILQHVLETNTKFSFWTSYRDRIMNDQKIVWEDNKYASFGFKSEKKAGIIIPTIITMGTVTRRAVEPTWMTAVNPKINLVGSELKSLIKAPEGHVIVGADVDSQELWIASLLGDSQFGFAGATAMGWMTLQGSKADQTDLHSRTAKILGMKRDDAKIFTYGRIYGAGARYATELLQKFNPSMSQNEASIKAKELYHATKGKQIRGGNIDNSLELSRLKLPNPYYVCGSESFMFNQLERIASETVSRTPVLNCAISDALISGNVNNQFMTSRVNWAVQSSAVDYLHLLVASMQYLMEEYDIEGRLLLTIHDEVRFLIKEQDQYRAAFALQISNLWTRTMFASRLGMNNLPFSVAFFTAIDFDKVLRKETNHSCITPSSSTPIPNGFSLDIYQLTRGEEGREGITSLNPDQRRGEKIIKDIRDIRDTGDIKEIDGNNNKNHELKREEIIHSFPQTQLIMISDDELNVELKISRICKQLNIDRKNREFNMTSSSLNKSNVSLDQNNTHGKISNGNQFQKNINNHFHGSYNHNYNQNNSNNNNQKYQIQSNNNQKYQIQSNNNNHNQKYNQKYQRINMNENYQSHRNGISSSSSTRENNENGNIPTQEVNFLNKWRQQFNSSSIPSSLISNNHGNDIDHHDNHRNGNNDKRGSLNNVKFN